MQTQCIGTISDRTFIDELKITCLTDGCMDKYTDQATTHRQQVSTRKHEQTSGK